MDAKSGSKKRSKIIVNSIAIEHGDALWRFLARKLVSAEEAEDLAQEALVSGQQIVVKDIDSSEMSQKLA